MKDFPILHRFFVLNIETNLQNHSNTHTLSKIARISSIAQNPK